MTFHQTAHEAFEARATEVEQALHQLRLALAAKKEREAGDPTNWGHAGDLARVCKLLEEASATLGPG